MSLHTSKWATGLNTDCHWFKYNRKLKQFLFLKIWFQNIFPLAGVLRVLEALSNISDGLKILVKQIPSLVPCSHLPIFAALPHFVLFCHLFLAQQMKITLETNERGAKCRC